MSEFFRFPHTPHIAWLGAGKPRDDKVLSTVERNELLDGDILVEEKVDGANVGFSVTAEGETRAQNRGSYLDLDAPAGQWKPLKRWLALRKGALAEALFPDLILFGEWCYAVHSVRYTRLPDWFLAFDVYDRERGEFWPVERRDGLVRTLDIAPVPRRGAGRFALDTLKRLLVASALSDGHPEGVYVRKESAGRLVTRAKLVRPEFAQAIGEHWSRRGIETNRLASQGEHPCPG
jgi:ATP-dependent RNA circularization protein (DNA/RNA ligase family)